MPKDSRGHGSNKRFDNTGPRYQKQVERKNEESYRAREAVKKHQAAGNVRGYLLAVDKKNAIIKRNIAKTVRMIGFHDAVRKKRREMSKTK